RAAGRLGVEPKSAGRLVLCPVTPPQGVGPQHAGRPVLRYLLEQVVVRVEEEAQPRREVVDPQAAGEALVDVVEPVGQGERYLLHRRGTGLADVVAAYRHRVPAGHVPGAELDQ